MDVDIERLRRHVLELASMPRPCESDALETARRYTTQCLEAAGWQVERHRFEAGGWAGRQLAGVNLVARHRDHPVSDGPRFCIGAHLDSLPETPGADDNASAVAALLEIARLLPGLWPNNARLELELIVFDLEENGMLGGAEHAQLMKAGGVDLWGMVSLEMLGYCDHSAGSQALPESLVGFYPDTGDFIAVIGNQNSQRLIDQFSTGLRLVEGLPVETLAVPSNGEAIEATRLSDHSPFWDAGYQALMITDTSFMRNPHYHQPSDTPDTLDMDFLSSVTQGCLQAVRLILTEAMHAG